MFVVIVFTIAVEAGADLIKSSTGFLTGHGLKRLPRVVKLMMDAAVEIKVGLRLYSYPRALPRLSTQESTAWVLATDQLRCARLHQRRIDLIYGSKLLISRCLFG